MSTPPATEDGDAPWMYPGAMYAPAWGSNPDHTAPGEDMMLVPRFFALGGTLAGQGPIAPRPWESRASFPHLPPPMLAHTPGSRQRWKWHHNPLSIDPAPVPAYVLPTGASFSYTEMLSYGFTGLTLALAPLVCQVEHRGRPDVLTLPNFLWPCFTPHHSRASARGLRETGQCT